MGGLGTRTAWSSSGTRIPQAEPQAASLSEALCQWHRPCRSQAVPQALGPGASELGRCWPQAEAPKSSQASEGERSTGSWRRYWVGPTP